jgi:Pyruvate/2-oxoacid:ferredoxin oxidoreductase delta subunit
MDIELRYFTGTGNSLKVMDTCRSVFQDSGHQVVMQEIKTKMAAGHILNGIRKNHKFHIPERYTVVKFYWDYWSFKFLGIQNMWRMFKTYDTCSGCGICVRICPTRSIRLADSKPVWSATCEQCMRCVNFCPDEAIYQSFGGDTIVKNRYIEPDFNPARR